MFTSMCVGRLVGQSLLPMFVRFSSLHSFNTPPHILSPSPPHSLFHLHMFTSSTQHSLFPPRILTPPLIFPPSHILSSYLSTSALPSSRQSHIFPPNILSPIFASPHSRKEHIRCKNIMTTTYPPICADIWRTVR